MFSDLEPPKNYSATIEITRDGVGGVRLKSEPGPPMTLGGAAAARVRLIVWWPTFKYAGD
jgi:hypothetical protein